MIEHGWGDLQPTELEFSIIPDHEGWNYHHPLFHTILGGWGVIKLSERSVGVEYAYSLENEQGRYFIVVHLSEPWTGPIRQNGEPYHMERVDFWKMF
jgi:hypothetical protein